ncbi:cytochrome c-type biogenesis protein CcmH [Uliginosibacterium gangwonense]|uniref:cytochrome c-type biogenesis protein CcmH n=1 Tax=Uliginosibacterium gangwonense TaxID=392736 RepID=UPI00047826BC
MKQPSYGFFFRICLLLILSMHTGFAQATEARPVADNPALEARVDALSTELRCLVCQNQTIADSQAGLAQDLRNQIREQLAAGRSEQEITDYLVQRYGDFILYRPPYRPYTLLLWGGPALLLFGGIGWLAFSLARQRHQHAEALSKESLDAARALLNASGTPKQDRT